MTATLSNTRTLTVVLAMTMAIAPLAVDTYLPSFPAIAASLQTQVHEISLSLSVYVIGLAIGQLVGGPLSDVLSRAKVMLSGLLGFCVASALLVQVESLTWLLVWRGLQAFFGGWAMVCVPAIVRDRFSGKPAARFFSLIGLIVIAAPALAPNIGSLLLEVWGWRSVFVFLSLYSAVMVLLVILVVVPFVHHSLKEQSNEGHGHDQPTDSAQKTENLSVWRRYQRVLSVTPALRFLLLQAFAFSVMLLFISHSPFIYQVHFGVGPTQFSLLFAANIVLMMVMNFTNRWLLNTYSPATILRWSLSLQGVGIVSSILVMLIHPSLYAFLPTMIVTVGAMGAISSNTQAAFMEFYPTNSGTAAALLGASQFAISGTVVSLSSLLPASVLNVVLVQAACSVLCLLLIWTCNTGQPNDSL